MIGRRGILKLIGLSPLAAKAAAEEKAISLSHMKGARALVAGVEEVASGAAPGSERVNSILRVGDYIKMFGVPEFMQEELRSRVSQVYALDPDIIAKKSWSFSVKIQEQRERNFHREIDSYNRSHRYEASQSAFKALTGWQWPW